MIGTLQSISVLSSHGAGFIQGQRGFLPRLPLDDKMDQRCGEPLSGADLLFGAVVLHGVFPRVWPDFSEPDKSLKQRKINQNNCIDMAVHS